MATQANVIYNTSCSDSVTPPGITDGSGGIRVETDNGVIAWNVNAIRQVATEFKAVAANFHEAHEQCAILVPKINAAWDSNLAAEKFEEKLDNGLVLHFEQGHHALEVLGNLLEKIADVYYDCEQRIKNGDYNCTYTAAENSASVEWSNQGFGVNGTGIMNRDIQAIGELPAGAEVAFPLGLPPGAFKAVQGNYTNYYDSNGKLIGRFNNTTYVFDTIPFDNNTYADKYGNGIAACANARRIQVSELTKDEINRLRNIFKNGVSGDVEFYRDANGKLYCTIANATGHAVGYTGAKNDLTSGKSGQTGAVTTYELTSDGHLNMLGGASIEDIKNAQAMRTANRRDEMSKITYNDNIDYSVNLTEKPESVPESVVTPPSFIDDEDNDPIPQPDEINEDPVTQPVTQPSQNPNITPSYSSGGGGSTETYEAFVDGQRNDYGEHGVDRNGKHHFVTGTVPIITGYSQGYDENGNIVNTVKIDTSRVPSEYGVDLAIAGAGPGTRIVDQYGVDITDKFDFSTGTATTKLNGGKSEITNNSGVEGPAVHVDAGQNAGNLSTSGSNAPLASGSTGNHASTASSSRTGPSRGVQRIRNK